MADLPRPFGSYLLLKSLGTGGSGDVFLARSLDAGKSLPSPIVIKRLHAQLASQPDAVRRFQHEAEVAVAIDSPHLAKVYDVGRIEESFYIAMEYLAGWTVARVIKDLQAAGANASIASAAEVVRGALAGLGALHGATHPETGASLGIVHRDIAPKNLMIGEDGVTRLIDLGLGKSSIQDWRTSTGVVMGSPGYMSPEQAMAEGVDRRSDLYALGVVLWEFLTLRRYIKKAPVPIMLRAQVTPAFVPPSQTRGDVSSALDAVCRKALELDPAKRFQSAGEFIAALDEAVPPREEEAPLATIVGEMLWGELGQSKTEVTKLLSIPHPPSPGSTTEVEVYAERTPVAFPTPLHNIQVAPAPGGVPIRAVLLLMGLTLLIGLGIGALVLRDPSTPITVHTPPPPAIEAATPRPEIAPVVRPNPEPEEPSEEMIAKPPKLRKLAKAEEAPPSPRPAKLEPAKSDRDRLLALMKRARTLRAKVQSTAKEAEVTAILGKAAQEASAPEVNAQVLAEIEAALGRLERD